MDNRTTEPSNDGSSPTYYVAKKTTVLSRIAGGCDFNVSTLRSGMLVEALGVLKDGGLRIRVSDPSGAGVWRKTEWLCHRYDLVPVSPNIWRYLAAVPVLQDRVRLASDRDLCTELDGIRVDSRVWLARDNPGADKVAAVVKYVGAVPELGPGFYFGLEVANTRSHPQVFDLVQQYFSCSRGNGEFATLNDLRVIKPDVSDAAGTDRISKFTPSESNGLLDNNGDCSSMLVENPGESQDAYTVEVTAEANREMNRWTGAPLEVTTGQLFEPVEPEARRKKSNAENFGNMEGSVVTGMVRPISIKGDLESICGKYRGIQGHHNSCYLDATLFSMFTFTSVFDNLLFRPPNEKDCAQYEEVQRVLREEIVNPLRKNLFVRADHVMKLRTLLEKLSSIPGLTSEEKDPEEFLTSLVAQILNAEPFLKLSSGQGAYHYQLFVEKDDHLNLPTVQQLLEQSFLTSNIRLKEVPSCLIIQMPRFGKSFKMYQKIQPTQLLDITDIIEDSPRQCTVCGKLAEFECKECYGQCGIGLESIAFCLPCLQKVHRHERRASHVAKKLTVPMEFAILQEHCPVPRLYLELSAVVCIETSHYVSFVKCGSGSEAAWCFFDSMADRKGEQNGYNIPEMVPCPDLPYWLSEEGANFLAESVDDRQLQEHAKRLLCDAYMCMYQSPDVMMYK